MAETEFDVQTTANLVEIDFTSITSVNNNPNFKIRIVFEGNAIATNGNNRFDNITLKGVEDPLSSNQFEKTMYQVYPNPFNNNLFIISSQNIQDIKVFDMLGKLIFNINSINNHSTSIDLSHLVQGFYHLKIITKDKIFIHKIIKQQ